MKFLALISFVAMTACAIAAEKKVAPFQLSVISAFPQEYQKAASAVGVAIRKDGLNPEEYFADVRVQKGSNILVFALCHKSEFEEKDRPLMVGDPCGKCRSVHYDIRKGKVTKIYRLQ